MGVVHLGLDPHGRAVAIKVLRAHIAYDPDARARLNREVATLSRVRHRLVAEVLDADVDGDQPYVVTRYVPGLTLDAEVRERGADAAGTPGAAGPRAVVGARGDPRRRRRAPRPQAGQRADPGRRPGRHRLRDRPRRRRRPADHDRSGDGYAGLPLAGGGRRLGGHRGHRLVGLGRDPGLRGERAGAVRARADRRGDRPGTPRGGRPVRRRRAAAAPAAGGPLARPLAAPGRARGARGAGAVRARRRGDGRRTRPAGWPRRRPGRTPHPFRCRARSLERLPRNRIRHPRSHLRQWSRPCRPRLRGPTSARAGRPAGGLPAARGGLRAAQPARSRGVPARCWRCSPSWSGWARAGRSSRRSCWPGWWCWPGRPTWRSRRRPGGGTSAAGAGATRSSPP